MPDTLTIIDGHSLLYQFHFAIRNLSTPQGEAIGATYGLTGLMLKFLREGSSHLAMCFDPKGKVFRHAIYPEYKANRPEMPEDLSNQFAYLKQIVEALGLQWVSVDNYEADDVMGTLAAEATRRGIDTVLVTRDKDARQLLSKHVRLYDNRKDEYVTLEDFKETTSLEPAQVIELMGLSGDTSDNIPGVPGVGEKTALNFIEKYGSLEETIAHADELPKAKCAKVKEFADQARLSRELVTIKTDVPLPFEFDRLKPSGVDAVRARDLFQKLGFNKYLQELETPEPTAAESIVTDVVTDLDTLKDVTATLREAGCFALDTETTGLDPMTCRLVGLSLSLEPGKAWYVPVQSPRPADHLDEASVVGVLKDLLEDASVKKVGHNIKYDSLVLLRAGIDLRGVTFDTMIASYLLDPGQRQHNLDALAERRLNHRMIPIVELIGKGKTQVGVETVELKRIAEYAGEDAEVTWRLSELLAPELERYGLRYLFDDIEMPLVEVLRDMERVGIALDVGRLEAMSGEMGRELEALTEEIYELSGEPFNIDSPRQLSVVLFETLSLPIVKKTKTGLSTDQEVLETLAAYHPLPKLLLKHRQLTKLKSTYVDVLPRMVNPETGRIHTSFNQTVTATGRLSSSDPNLQNVPVRGEAGAQIRRAFVASRPETVLIAADYSQVELRILAHLSKDEALRRDFAEGKDIHTETASRIFDVDPRMVDKEMRGAAKAINFGIIYGLSPYGLGRQIGVAQGKAKKIIDQYYDNHPGVEAFFTGVLEGAKTGGFVTTMTGRRRFVQGIKNPESRNRNQAERVAINTVIQGSAADMIKLAMLALHGKAQSGELAGDLLLQIHDELLFEVPREKAEEVKRIVDTDMATALELEVPVVVNVETGENWLDME